MPDRRRRTAFRLPLPARAALLMRESRPSSPDSSSQPASGSPSGSSSGSPSGPSSGSPSGSSPAPDSSSGSSASSSGSSGSSSSGSSGSSPDRPADDNPFAAPPAGRPDQPWQPRHPSGTNGEGGDEGSQDGSSSGGRPSWGSQWSSRQPGRGNGGFGSRSGGNGSGPNGKGGPDGGPGGLRWDPTDPTQRRARYAVLGGMWAFFFALFEFPEIAMLLGALSVYWAISSLRGQPKTPAATDRTAAGVGTGAAPGGGAASAGGASPAAKGNSRPHTTAAIGGLVTALLALLIVITTFTVQLVYRDYYTCVNDALTKTGAQACNEHLPKQLEPLFGVKE
ncbi:hypothetical protein [Streptomyces sp. cmx-18-6]|uniref:hypothetical protein n=1 Tax=Streptomyces sp. cmx-18-6 TaxID=2790930 RepID=UPI00397EA444